MYYNQQLIISVIYLLHIFVHSSTSEHPGHLKPFGSSGPFKQIAESTDGFPDPIVFFNDYVFKSHPILFRQALINDSHISMWNTDEQLNLLFSNNNETVHVETLKKESRKQDILSMTMKEFLERYQNEELYLVEEVPNLLR
jgi:lysine-specific demethylase 8